MILLINADVGQMNQVLDPFSQKLKQRGIGMFYFAEHGIQFNSENYLIPVDDKWIGCYPGC